jgi:hypothetical protein
MHCAHFTCHSCIDTNAQTLQNIVDAIQGAPSKLEAYECVIAILEAGNWLCEAGGDLAIPDR